MAVIKHTPATARAIRRSHYRPTFANSRKAGYRAPPVSGGYKGLFNVSFTSDEGEDTQVVTMTDCYIGRGPVSFQIGAGTPQTLEVDMPSGTKAYIGIEMIYKDNSCELITGSNFTDVSTSIYDPDTTSVKVPIWYCERPNTESSWSAVMPLYLIPRLLLRV